MAQLLLVLLSIPTVIIPLVLAFFALTKKSLITCAIFVLTALVAAFLLLMSDPEKSIFAVALLISSGTSIYSIAKNNYLSLFEKYLLYIPVAAFNSGLGAMLLIERYSKDLGGVSGDRIGLAIGALVFIFCAAVVGRKKKFL